MNPPPPPRRTTTTSSSSFVPLALALILATAVAAVARVATSFDNTETVAATTVEGDTDRTTTNDGVVTLVEVLLNEATFFQPTTWSPTSPPATAINKPNVTSSPTVPPPNATLETLRTIQTLDSLAVRLPPGPSPLHTDAYTGPRWSMPTTATTSLTSSYRLQEIGGWPVCESMGVCLQMNFGVKDAVAVPISWKRVAIGDSAQAEAATQTNLKSRGCGMPPFFPRAPYYDAEHILKSYLEGSPGKPVNATWLRGTTLLIDTFIPTPHYSHVLAKVVQAYNLMQAVERLEMPQIDRVLFLQQSRYPSWKRPLTTAVAQVVVGTLGMPRLAHNVSLFRDDVYRHAPLLCLERALEISDVYERKFASEHDLVNWRRRIHEFGPMIGLDDFPTPEACPKNQDDVMVLYRHEGKGLRSIQNYGTLNKVFDEVGICAWGYRNVTFGSSTPLRDQIRLFQDFGLVIGPHSSQLTNVAWSSNFSAVLEIRADIGDEGTYGYDPHWSRLPTPFCVSGWCAPAYGVTRKHADLATFSESMGFRNDILLNEAVFKADLVDALAEQRRRYARRPDCKLPRYLEAGAADKC